MHSNVEQNPPQEETEENEPGSEGESQINRRDNFPIVDLKAYNTDRKQFKRNSSKSIKKLTKITGDKKGTEETIKEAEFKFMLDLKTLIAKSATDAELNRVRDAMRRGDKNTALVQYQPIFEKMPNKWGLTFNDEKIIIPTELRRKLMETLHFCHAGSIKILATKKLKNEQKTV